MMAVRVCGKVFAQFKKPPSYIWRLDSRSLLSAAYGCDEAWDLRQQTDILKQVNVANFAMRLQEKLDKEGVAPAIDFDIMANTLDKLDPIQLDFAENLFHRFRSTSSCVTAADSMSYAVVRALLKMGEAERLLRIVKDKMRYGIFLNDHAANLCMDYFIKQNKYIESSQIAADMMLQEDFGTPLTRYLAWYSCHLTWKHVPLEELQPQLEPKQEDEEEQLVRVKFVENPWYDDHWDLPTLGHQVGKTLAWLTQNHTDLLHTSYHIIGSGLWHKFPHGLQILQDMADNKRGELATEAVEYYEKCLQAANTSEPPMEQKHPGLMRLEDVMPRMREAQKAELLEKLQALLVQLKGQGQLVECDLGEQLQAELEDVRSDQEEQDIQVQQQLFRTWDNKRASELNIYLDEIQSQQRKVDIAERLKKLTETEEKLHYFDDEERVSLGMSKVAKERPIEEVTEEEQFVPPPQERGKMF